MMDNQTKKNPDMELLKLLAEQYDIQKDKGTLGKRVEDLQKQVSNTFRPKEYQYDPPNQNKIDGQYWFDPALVMDRKALEEKLLNEKTLMDNPEEVRKALGKARFGNPEMNPLERADREYAETFVPGYDYSKIKMPYNAIRELLKGK